MKSFKQHIVDFVKSREAREHLYKECGLHKTGMQGDGRRWIPDNSKQSPSKLIAGLTAIHGEPEFGYVVSLTVRHFFQDQQKNRAVCLVYTDSNDKLVSVTEMQL